MTDKDTSDAPPRHDRRATDDLTRDFQTLGDIASRLIDTCQHLDTGELEPVLRVVASIQKIQAQSIITDEHFAKRNGTMTDDRADHHARLRAEIGRALDRIRETKAAAVVPEFSR
jgi:uncharacterized damage-inducible protein DinB